MPRSNRPVVWRPHPGGQWKFLACPARQVIATGNRGGGKTDVLLMDFTKGVDDFGADWWGVLFRRSYPQFEQVIQRGKKLFGSLWGEDVQFLQSPVMQFRWKNGARLLLRFAARPSDYEDTLGWEVPWLGFEELPEWPDPEIYNSLLAINRTATKGIPLRIRATANAYGRGKNWVKRRFIDPAPPTKIFTDDAGMKTCRIRIPRAENLTAEAVDPNYLSVTIQAATLGNPAKRAAWVEEDWTATSGGLLDDVWDEAVHVLPPFEIPPSWYIDRSYDYGSSKPWACLWWAESDGTKAVLADGTERHFPPGTLFAVAEAYGATGTEPNTGDRKVASAQAWEIKRRETNFPWGARVKPGPADSAIFDKGAVSARSVADEFADVGIKWLPGDKASGSRVRGAELIRNRLGAAKAEPMEKPGLYVFDTCRDWIATVPSIPRDEKNEDDADTEAEDHLYDATRYRCLATRYESGKVAMRW